MSSANEGIDLTKLIGRSEQAALVIASAMVPNSFTKSLTARSTTDQGLVTGLSFGLSYVLTLLTHDTLEVGAARLAPYLPSAAGATPEQRQRTAILVVDLAVVPLGLGVQKLITRQPDEAMARGFARQVGWRVGATGLAGASFAVAEAAAQRANRALGTDVISRIPIAVPTGLALALLTDRNLIEEIRGGTPNPEAPDSSSVKSLGLAGGVVVAGTIAATGERFITGLAGQGLAELLPGTERFWRLVSHGAVAGAVGAVGYRFFEKLVHGLEAGTAEIDPVLEQVNAQELVPPTVSGSVPSLVKWESIGREGRRHGFAGVRPEPMQNRPLGLPDLSIPTIMGEPAVAAPVQVYVGLDSAEAMQDRVDLALAEMDRSGAWDRSLIMLISPTGTGYVNYVAIAAVQYLTRGDMASVTLQYSKRPSPLSLTKVKDAREQNRLLWARILQRVRDMPLDKRPKVVLFGESLGAHTSQDVFLHWGTLGLKALGIDRALWIGTPYGSEWAKQVTHPNRLDVDTDSLAVVNDFEQLEELPEDRRKSVRYVLLSHDNDGVTKFGSDILSSQPRFLSANERPAVKDIPGRSPRGVSPSMRWRPIVTFFQLVIDMKNAQIPGAYKAWAHDYRPDLARFIREVYNLPCTEEQMVAVEAALQQREELREKLFAAAPKEDDQPKGDA